MKILIGNTSTDPFSLDVKVGETILRDTIPGNGNVDVGSKVAADDLNQNSIIRRLVATGLLTVSTESEASDVDSLLDSQILQYAQVTAATQAAIFIGTSDLAGVIEVEAQVGAIPGALETMTFDVLVNGVTVLTSALIADAATSPVARTTLYGAEGGALVAKGDEISVALTYAAGTPTPIVNSAIRVKILKA